jgi:HKD family nuclease
MAKKQFIIQGFTKQTHADAVRGLFGIEDIKRVLVSVAFVSESGVGLVHDAIKAHGKATTVFAGIRNDITTYQAMTALHGLGGTLYAVDTGARTVTFHPKLFLVRGAQAARMILGSANLTLGGLNNNIEFGLGVEFDLANKADAVVVDQIESELDQLPKDFPENVIEVKKAAQLKSWLEDGRLMDEMAVPPPRPAKSAKGKAAGTDTVPRIKLAVAPIRAKPKKASKPAAPPAAGAASAAPVSTPATGVDLELMWESKTLARRDLNIPDGKTTNKSGSINLDKGLMEADVDHRHYFRDDVFPALNWKAATKTTEEAETTFQLITKGISRGEFELRIGHTTSTNTTSYKQRNAMTRLSWGDAKDYVGDEDFIGRTLSLYRDKADPTRFVLEID